MVRQLMTRHEKLTDKWNKIERMVNDNEERLTRLEEAVGLLLNIKMKKSKNDVATNGITQTTKSKTCIL